MTRKVSCGLMSESIESEYERRRAGLAGEFARMGARGSTLAQILLVALAALAYTAYQGIHRGDRAWWALLPLGVIVGVVPELLRARRQAHRAARLLDVYERGAARMDGSQTQSGHTGEAFCEAGHLYERDLDILGADSIFGMLATTRTAVGERALARLLLHGASAETVRARQAAVRELAPMLELRERVALMGQSAFDELPAESFERWLDKPDAGLAMWMRWVLIALTVTWVGLAIAALLHRVDMATLPRNLAALLALEGAFALWLRPRAMAELEAAQRLAGQTAILREGLRLMREQRFESELLRGLQTNAADQERALKALSGSLALVEQRAKEWFYAPALMLAVGTHAAISLQAWKRAHGDAMRGWIAAWAEFEAALALGTYAAEHHENVYPEMVEGGGAVFEAEGLVHPLLPRAQAVANDVRLDAETRFLLISGSNMAGKSTLLRAIGCNAVLALAGVPICARAATMSASHVGASLALVDSLAEGKSKFLTEVERLRDLVALAKTNPANSLFLIDEIFSGTNSADRRAAAEAVLRGLVREGAIGALSTHDLALAGLAEVPELRGRNVHMASPDESDPLGFDYVLKPGVNRTTNAMAIVKMLGLE
ncbi:MAG: hypothetical protein M3R43_01040 [Acidobacteriota bacterium]|nr:hypothetical protein [Acidobacteriota bacterium]